MKTLHERLSAAIAEESAQHSPRTTAAIEVMREARDAISEKKERCDATKPTPRPPRDDGPGRNHTDRRSNNSGPDRPTHLQENKKMTNTTIEVRRVNNGWLVMDGPLSPHGLSAESTTRVAETKESLLDIVSLWAECVLEDEEPKNEN